MQCNCCKKRLNIGMIHKFDKATEQEYKSCPHCSKANGNEHVFHPYPESFGNSTARITDNNPDGDQSYCFECRGLAKGVDSQVYMKGRTCSSLVEKILV